MADLKEALDASDNVLPSNGRTMNLKGALLEICDELDKELWEDEVTADSCDGIHKAQWVV